MEVFIGLVVGIVIGCVCSAVIRRIKSSGTLYVNDSEDEPYLFLELDRNVGDISRKKQVSFKVILKKFTSQK